MDKKRLPFDGIDWLLLAAIVGLSVFLVGELAEPAMTTWQNRPRPGVQVCRQYIAHPDSPTVEDGKEGREERDGNESRGLTVASYVNYLLYLPREYPKDNKWPLVIFLHGAGERGDDLEIVRHVGLPKQIEQGDSSAVGSMVLNHFVLVSPQCPKDSGWNAEVVLGLIEHVCSTLAVDRDRVYLTGHSMGGFATWDIACQEPGRLAAIAPLCGGGAAERAGRLVNVPVWAFHSANDNVVPLSASRSMVEAVKKCGGRSEFTVYRNEGHGILDVTYENPRLYEWLLAQRREQLHTKIESDDQAR